MNALEIDKAITHLEQSPLFNVSLASREMFHSNFLYWLYLINKGAFKQIIADLLRVKKENLHWGRNWRVLREHLNFDLCVVNSEDNLFGYEAKVKSKKEIVLFVLENKVKSLPTKIQLDKYRNKCLLKLPKNCIAVTNHENTQSGPNQLDCYTQHFLLLSLSKSCFDGLLVDDMNHWICRDYQDLSECINASKMYFLQKCALKQYSSIYLQHILDDYCSYISSLQILMNTWNKEYIHTNDFFKEKYLLETKDGDCIGFSGYIYDSVLIKRLKALRVFDVFEKTRMAFFQHRLNSFITKEIKYCQQHLGYKCEVAYNFTRGKPLLEVRVSLTANLNANKDCIPTMYIQLQGNQYRHAILETGNRVNDTVNKIINSPYYHFFLYPAEAPKNSYGETMCKYPKLCKNEKNPNIQGQRNAYCCFAGNGKNFIYQWKKIPAESSVEDVFIAIREDLRNIINNLESNNK